MSGTNGSLENICDPLLDEDPRTIGPYRILGRLGAGGMGRVYLGQSRSGLLVAVKTVRTDRVEESGFRTRFAREAAAARQVSGVYTAAVVDADAAAEIPWLATAYVPAPSLQLLVRRVGPLPVGSVMWLAAGIAEALDSIHRVGLIHRDLKPSNVLVTRDNPKVIDFGLVRSADGGVQITQAVIGTPQYMSPEQALDTASVTPATDVYSLGATLLYAATGRLPYQGDTPVNVLARLLSQPPDLSGVPQELTGVIRHCMQRDPTLRPTPNQLLESIGGTWLQAPGGFGAEHWLPQEGHDLVDSFERRRRPDSRGGPSGSGPSGSGPSGSGPSGSGPSGRGADISGANTSITRQARTPSGPSGPSVRFQPSRDLQPSRHLQGKASTPSPPSSPLAPPTPPLSPEELFPDALTDRAGTGGAEPVRVGRRTLLRLTGGVAVGAAVGAGVWGAGRLLGSTGTQSGPRPWVFTTGAEVYSSPAVAGGVVYIGSNDAHLYAVDAVTGRERWRYRTGGAVTSSPAVAGGQVYVGCNDSHVHAVDAGTGQARWTFRTGAVMHSSPAVAGGVVYIGCRDRNLYAIDAVTGTERWRFTGGDWFNSSPTVADGGVYVGCRDHNIYGLDAVTGKKRWQYTTGSTVDSSPAVSGDMLWIGGDDHDVYALNARSGAWVWQFTAGNGVVSTPLVVDGVVYVGSDDANLYALDASTGRDRWRFATGNGIRSSPTVANGLVYVGSRDRNVYAVDVITGEVRWRFATQGPVDDSSPVVVDGLVYVGSLDHQVYALNAATGAGP
ncbi:serine/threonine-protein kinase [Frankia sp. Cppng1_Ct_nod]|uniref:serine/threonine-protein kinase n=1 Tax=Frankia sp. Cppng1_Ct_nod TaxID=2897162 RepID=UPI00202513A3|nr:serine/threonine-protein kinase [Frankia sp. Cppng1_Ct_nod]